MKGSTIELLGQLERLKGAAEEAAKEARQEGAIAANNAKKMDFMRAKEKEYVANLAKKEAMLAKAGGMDLTLR